MREEVARVVFPVLATGLRYKEEIRAADTATLDLKQAQKEMMGLLNVTAQARAWIDPGNVVQDFLGIRYTLACWLDEIFLMDDSPWKVQWNGAKLETTLYGTLSRAWKFWEQARLAERLTEPDALEVFYLCVVLGFRGDPEAQDAPKEGKVHEWCDTIKAQIDEAPTDEVPLPPETIPTTFVPELRGHQKLRTMLPILIGCVLLAVFVTAFVLVFKTTR